MKVRPYQARAVRRVRVLVRKARLVVLPAGVGKLTFLIRDEAHKVRNGQ